MTIDIPFQEPNSTEKEVFLKLQNIIIPNHISYIAYPWANLIEYARKDKINLYSYLLKNNLPDYFNNKINITTWQYYQVYPYIDLFKKMNINIVFSPHAEKNKFKYYYEKYNIKILPIFLIPIINPSFKIHDNIEIIDSNINYKFSFIGNINYANNKDLTKKRTLISNLLKLRNDCYLKINTSWHLDNKIYGKDLGFIKFNSDKEYIQKLNENNYFFKMNNTLYPIVPLGMGPNSFRVTESIAFGKVPIIISDNLWLPIINNYQMEDYCIIIKEKDIPNLNYILDNLNEIELNNKQKIIIEIKNSEEFTNLAYPVIKYIN